MSRGGVRVPSPHLERSAVGMKSGQHEVKKTYNRNIRIPSNCNVSNHCYRHKCPHNACHLGVTSYVPGPEMLSLQRHLWSTLIGGLLLSKGRPCIWEHHWARNWKGPRQTSCLSRAASSSLLRMLVNWISFQCSSHGTHWLLNGARWLSLNSCLVVVLSMPCCMAFFISTVAWILVPTRCCKTPSVIAIYRGFLDLATSGPMQSIVHSERWQPSKV